MIGFSLKFPQIHGKINSLSEMRTEIGLSRRWHFRKISFSKYGVLKRKLAFIIYGASYDFGVVNSKNETKSSLSMDTSRFINGKASVNHPILQNLIGGVEFITHISISKSKRGYVSLGVVFRYLF